jgi:hypothetical protein
MIPQERQEHTLDWLDQLYAAERKSLLPRLAEMGVFVEGAAAHEMEEVRRMVAEQARHAEWLADAAERSGGGLAPACADMGTAGLHYCDLRVLLPAVIANLEQLIAKYGQAMDERTRLTSPAAEAIARIYNRHTVHLEQLQSLRSRL